MPHTLKDLLANNRRWAASVTAADPQRVGRAAILAARRVQGVM